jgi:hypothetical protein
MWTPMLTRCDIVQVSFPTETRVCQNTSWDIRHIFKLSSRMYGAVERIWAHSWSDELFLGS